MLVPGTIPIIRRIAGPAYERWTAFIGYLPPQAFKTLIRPPRSTRSTAYGHATIYVWPTDNPMWPHVFYSLGPNVQVVMDTTADRQAWRDEVRGMVLEHRSPYKTVVHRGNWDAKHILDDLAVLEPMIDDSTTIILLRGDSNIQADVAASVAEERGYNVTRLFDGAVNLLQVHRVLPKEKLACPVLCH